MVSWDQGRIAEALDHLRDAARHGTVISPDARHFQPLLALAACLVDLRRFDEAATVLRAAADITLDGIPAAAMPALLRARMHLARGRLGDAAAEAEAALATAAALGADGYTSVAHCVLAVIALRRGDLATAADTSRAARSGRRISRPATPAPRPPSPRPRSPRYARDLPPRLARSGPSAPFCRPGAACSSATPPPRPGWCAPR